MLETTTPGSTATFDLAICDQTPGGAIEPISAASTGNDTDNEGWRPSLSGAPAVPEVTAAAGSRMQGVEDVYELFQRGTTLLEQGHNHQAAIPLARARDLAPDKTSIREALGRALFHTQRYEDAAAEFQAVVDRAPTNDFALFCLGRCLQLLGRDAEARQPLALAATLQPQRRDYQEYRDRARARATRREQA